MKNLTPEQFSAQRAQGVKVLDVRQPDELVLASLSGSINIPLNELPARLHELDPQQAIAILCHHGMRSEMAGHFLERQGFSDVCHLVGGIDAWSLMVDASVPRY
jgi:rhodanese-related sulfurtransferase